MFDLLIKNGNVVTPAGTRRMQVAVLDGKIHALEAELTGPARKTIDAAGKLVFPGFIDAHTHMGIPIMNTFSVDDFESGSVAAACGGVTTIVDFTVQEPGQSLHESVATRLEKAGGKCHVDYALHVNVTDQAEARLPEIPQLIEDGFRAFKVFSTYRQAGMMVTWAQFRQVLQTVDAHGGLLCLHAEDNDLVEQETARHISSGDLAAIFHPRSRTAEAEARAIARAAEIARELDAALYIVHLSSRAGLEAALEARARGSKLFLETCPQYLVLTEECYLRKDGHLWITTPPLRREEDVEALWQALADGSIDVVATDHCPFTVAQKDAGGGVFHQTPNGLPGVETLFPLLYTFGVAQGRISLSRLVQVLAGNPARIFGLSPHKGGISKGLDADLVIWDPEQTVEIKAEQLHGKADWSPYSGLTVSGRVDYTILRGQVLVEEGRFRGESVVGQLLRAQKGEQR
ncbi:MAG: dihydropyrimidinase [Calditrichaeota bacterium]|nr:MAG: dihydropyrimidinase [Calditrichota bacterium]